MLDSAVSSVGMSGMRNSAKATRHLTRGLPRLTKPSIVVLQLCVYHNNSLSWMVCKQIPEMEKLQVYHYILDVLTCFGVVFGQCSGHTSYQTH